MLHTNNSIIKHKAGLLNLAEELSNVSRAYKVIGVSNDAFYRYQEQAIEGGLEALIDKNRRSPNLKNRTAPVIPPPLKKPLTPMRLTILYIGSTEQATITKA